MKKIELKRKGRDEEDFAGIELKGTEERFIVR
jgi:hypothetical protein